MENRVAENHRRYRERKETYKCFGYDIEKERQFILEKARPLNGSILEVGTGKGYFTIALAREGFCFTSVDISEDEQSFARLNLKYYGLQDQVFFLAMDASSLGFEKGSFDVIFSINMMHHLDDPYPTVDEMTRVCSPRGKIIISDFTDKGFDVVDHVHVQEGRTHARSLTGLKEIEKYLLQKDFVIEKHRSKHQDIMISYRITAL